ncbi:MAG: hypothetical protein ACI9D5_000987 [Candidatus Endobugula sp.]|jgi:hypothetical protein
MYIDGVIVFSLVGIAIVVGLMVYLGKYAKKQFDMDAEQDKREHEIETLK